MIGTAALGEAGEPKYALRLILEPPGLANGSSFTVKAACGLLDIPVKGVPTDVRAAQSSGAVLTPSLMSDSTK